MKSFKVEIYVDVNDVTALHAHAMNLATSEPGGTPAPDAEAMIGTADAPDIGGCLRWVFDPGQSPPGTSIQDSACDEI